MDYSSFLFNNLLRCFDKEIETMPYDLMYTAHLDLMREFLTSPFNTDEKSEYVCMVNFLKSIYTEKN